MSFIYGENGRGKTTLAAILRSLAAGEAGLIAERKRLGAPHDPHVVVEVGGQLKVFQNGIWSATVPEIMIFDDEFVAQNVCSGIEIGASHRQNLHELILGAQGVALNATLQTLVAQIEEHNRALRVYEQTIPSGIRHGLTLDQFCSLPLREEIDNEIESTERQLAAAREADEVRRRPAFVPFDLPAIDLPSIKATLERDLPTLQRDAAERVQTHLDRLGSDSANWVSEGMAKIRTASADSEGELCPFCAQDLRGSPLIAHYEAYFSEQYASLRDAVGDQGKLIAASLGGDVPAAFERAIRVAVQTQEFWSRFTVLEPIELDTAAIARAWNAARDAVLEPLRAKYAAPLDRFTLSDDATEKVQEYDRWLETVRLLSESLQNHNKTIELIREQAATADARALVRDLENLRASKARHNEPHAARCDAYAHEKAAKATTEGQREQARAALDNYRQNVFPAYEAAINDYLQRFNAGFRLGHLGSVNTRAGSACQYNVVINNIAVSPTAAEGPSFRNTLSAGDRNTLALAFFFASIDQDPARAQKIVIIDDPMTSLDEHRSLTTVQETRRLLDRVSQVIVLSHSKPFLCALWNDTVAPLRSAIRVVRQGNGSTVEHWDVNADCVTPHDRRYELTRQYLAAPGQVDERRVAEALRPMLEQFLRVAFSPDFPPGSMIGANFLPRARQRAGTADEIISQRDIDELQDILDYANRFHHDTNPAYETQQINDQEVQQFTTRALRFISRK
nr:AAA family ATPase [Sphingomonas sp.]